MSKKPSFESHQVFAGLKRMYPEPGFLVMREVRDATGFDATRSADAIAIGMYASRGLRIEGFEIKVSRSDWLNELKQPLKAKAWSQFCHRWWLAVGDRSIVKENELPDGWGLLAFGKGGKLEPVVKATTREPQSFSMRALTALIYAGRCQLLLSEKDRIDLARAEGRKEGLASFHHQLEEHKRIREDLQDLEAALGMPLVNLRGKWGPEPSKVGAALKALLDEGLNGELERWRERLGRELNALDRAAERIREAIKCTEGGGIHA